MLPKIPKSEKKLLDFNKYLETGWRIYSFIQNGYARYVSGKCPNSFKSIDINAFEESRKNYPRTKLGFKPTKTEQRLPCNIARAKKQGFLSIFVCVRFLQ